MNQELKDTEVADTIEKLKQKYSGRKQVWVYLKCNLL